MFPAFPDLSALFRPRSVALVVASSRPGSIGRIAIDNAIASRIEGDLFLVGADTEAARGRPCHASLADLPAVPIDTVLVAVPADAVPGVIAQCAQRGVRFCIVITSGFGEEGEAGAARQARMLESAAAAGLRIYGPNCPGLTNGNAGIGLNISPSFLRDLGSGPIGLATQGGGLGRTVIQRSRHGPRVGVWASAGNECDLELADLIAHLAQDPEIRAIAVIAEGFGSGERFIAAATRALDAGKPLVMLKVGRSAYGEQAAATHTAAIAGSDAINSAVFRKYGVIRVDDADQLHETAALALRAAHAREGGIVVFGFSGGAGGFAADLIGAAGLSLASFSPGVQQDLRAMLPPYAAMDNPIDLTTRVFTEAGLHAACLQAVCDAPDTGTVLVPIPGDYGGLTAQLAKDLVQVSARTDALIVPVWMGSDEGEGLSILREGGMTPFRSISSAVAALARLKDYRLARRSAAWPLCTGAPPPLALHGEVALSEVDAKGVLASIGIPAPREQVVHSAEQAADYARSIGRPVALKIVSPDLAHKTEVGGVELGVAPADAASSFRAVMHRVGAAAPDARIAGVLVSEMVADGQDFILGVHRDAIFGPILTLGLGGVLVELIQDVLHFPLPLREGEIAQALDGRIGRLLAGFRGGPELDRDALIAAAESLAAFAFRHRADLADIEINPLRVLPKGRGALALDAVLRGAAPSVGSAMRPGGHKDQQRKTVTTFGMKRT